MTNARRELLGLRKLTEVAERLLKNVLKDVYIRNQERILLVIIPVQAFLQGNDIRDSRLLL